jgi:Ca2+ transporting ATPase
VKTITNFEAFKDIVANLRVLGRAEPEDKYLMVVGLKQMGNVVASTGEGTNDILALEEADVGFAMGGGCSCAKDVSDMILINNDF